MVSQYNEIINNAIMKKTFVLKFILLSCVLLGVKNYSFANPVFIFDTPKSLPDICMNSITPIEISSYLGVRDGTSGKTETYTVTDGPKHGRIVTGSTATSAPGVIVPAGWYYIPDPDYSGNDNFTVEVTDGTTSAQLQLQITFKILPEVRINGGLTQANAFVVLTPSSTSPTTRFSWVPEKDLTLMGGGTNDAVARPKEKKIYTVIGTLNSCSNKASIVITPITRSAAMKRFKVGIGAFICPGSYTQNKTYTWQQVPGSGNSVTSSSTYVLSESGYTPMPMGLNVSGNLILGENNWLVKFLLSPGLGLTLQNHAQLVYMLGCGICINNKVNITVGDAAMFVNKLANNLQAVADQQINYPAPQNVSYYKELESGPYFSISFNLF